MTDTQQNLIGTDGFEFVEFACTDSQQLDQQFRQLGFHQVGKHRRLDVYLYKQHDIHFIVNCSATEQAAQFAQLHRDSANAMALRVKDVNHALQLAIERGAQQVHAEVGPMEISIPAIEGVGGSLIYLVDRYGLNNIYQIDFDLDAESFNNSSGPLDYLDHLTHNLFRGNLKQMADFYERVFEFSEAQYFQIQGVQTGLVSKAMQSSCQKIRIPLNESADEQSQIEEFLHRYNGEGIQHIALHTNDIFQAVDTLRANGVKFQETPDTYYDAINDRVKGHDQDIEAMRERQILIDGSPEAGYLLQIFTQDFIGPIFFEIIQRMGNQGFGEGNFQALFESIERDQQLRGVLSETI